MECVLLHRHYAFHNKIVYKKLCSISKKIKNLIFNFTKGEILIHIKMENWKILFITIIAMALSILVVKSQAHICMIELDPCNSENFWSFFGYPTCEEQCSDYGYEESKCTKHSNVCKCFYIC